MEQINYQVIVAYQIMDSLEQKQKYLRQTILQCNYDPEQFIHYLTTQLQIQQLQLQIISFQDLRRVAQSFIQVQKDEQPTSSKVIKEKVIYVNFCLRQQQSGLFDYQFEEQIKCIVEPPFAENIQVFVPKFQIVQKEGFFLGFGSKTQIYFCILSNLVKSEAKRLAQDVQWLSKKIGQVYPLQAIPQFITVSKEDTENHQKRRIQIQQYLKIVASRQQMTSSDLFYQFLVAPADLWTKFQKNYESIEHIKTVSNIKNQSGKVKIAYRKDIRDFVRSTGSYNRKAESIHTAIAAGLQRVTFSFENTIKEMNGVVDMFAELHETYQQMTKSSLNFKNESYSEVLINLNNFFHVLSQHLSNYNQSIFTKLSEYHKISLNYDKAISRLFSNVAHTQNSYLQQKLRLHRKKQRLFPTVSRWEVQQKLLENRRFTKEQAFDIMLPKQTQQQNEDRRWLVHLYNKYFQEMDKYLKFQVTRYVETYSTLAGEILMHNNTQTQQLTRFLQQFRHQIKS